jgi:hypothetical protein
MITTLALTSLFVAAADDADREDPMSRFHLLRGMGDLDGAYAVFMESLGVRDRGLVLAQLEKWVQESDGLEVLKDRLIEYQAAWASCVLDEMTSSFFRYQWPLTLQFENTFFPSGSTKDGDYPLLDFGVPWFLTEDRYRQDLVRYPWVRIGGHWYHDLAENSAKKKTETTLEFRLPNWPQDCFTDRRKVVHVGGERAILWSADDKRALVGVVVNEQDGKDRTVFHFAIVPHAAVTRKP